jgi:predicted P-loop ATPase
MSFIFTSFTDVYAQSFVIEDMEVVGLEELITTTTAPTKERLPVGKLARFGVQRSPPDTNGKGGGSLRWDQNVLMTSGGEGDYDGGLMTFQEAVRRLTDSGIVFIAHTTARHSPLAPRWRVWAPFSKELPPAERARMINRVNGIVGGVLSRESWVISQGFFIGHVDGVPFEIASGGSDQYIDQSDELDAGALPYQPTQGSSQAGKAGKGKVRPDCAALSEFDLRELIKQSQAYYDPAFELACRWAYQDIPAADTEANLRDLFDEVPQAQQDRQWSQARGSIGRWVQKAYAKIAKKKGIYFRALVTHLGEDENWRGSIRFNLFTQQIELSDPYPPQSGQPIGTYRALRDPVDILETMMCVQENGFPKAGKDTVTSAMVVVAEHRAHHPVREWLRSLEWDGHERLNRLFLEYFPGELPDGVDQEHRDEVLRYYEKTGECFIVGAVARIMTPGCKVDCLPCLVSPQGWGKSRGLQALVPDPLWFSDDLSTNVVDRDAKESLSGKLLIELAEFPHMRRDIERVKAWFSRHVDRYRRAYGRLNMDHPRQCVFCASTNNLEFLDMTGNRRVWPIPLAGPVDVTVIERDREQLWAEAMHCYYQGLAWWLTPEIEAIAGNMQDAYVEDDEWDNLILDFLDRRYPEKPDGTRSPFTRRAVVEGIGFSYGVPGAPNFPTARDEKRVERRLRRLGFRPAPHRPRSGAKRERFWRSIRKS